MKKIMYFQSIFILFFSLMIFSCKETIIYEGQKEYFNKEQGILYYKGSPYNGKLIEFVNGEKTITTFRDGKVEGGFEHYYTNGQLNEVGSFKNDKKEGDWKTYHENGNISSTGPYLNGMKEGNWIYYFEDGKVKSKGEYSVGSKNKIWENYYETGILFERVTYKVYIDLDGLGSQSYKDGFYEDFEPNGEIKSKGYYEMGKWVRYEY